MSSKLKQVGLVASGLIAGIFISLNYSASAGKDAATSALPIEELRSFADVYNAIKQGYVEPVEDKKLITHAISGMLANLDPHSAYLDADSFKDLQVSTQGEFGGLGIEVGMEDGFVKVVAPIDDTPAQRAGLKSGDLIIKLDDTLVKGLTLNEAVKKMRGKPKTQIRLTVVRKSEPKPFEVTLTREKIKVQSVKSKLLEGSLGYLRVTQFQEETAPDVVKHLEKLAKEDKDAKGEGIKGLVLDLRNDPGGLLNGAVGVSAAFLPPKTLVTSTDGRTEDAKRRYLASPEDYQRGQRDDIMKNLPAWARTTPMVVLVNAGSASASEIVAGALQDHKRAVIMGTQTFGKGSVQTVLPCPTMPRSSSPPRATSRPRAARSRPRASRRTSSSRKAPTAARASVCARPTWSAISAATRKRPSPRRHPSRRPSRPTRRTRARAKMRTTRRARRSSSPRRTTTSSTRRSTCSRPGRSSSVE
jgi:carboxyl-terminal processing protease